MKAYPDIGVRASQVRWMEEHIKTGGLPLFLIQCRNVFAIVPGARAADIRDEPEEETVLRYASTIWIDRMPPSELFKVMRNPNAEYKKCGRDTD